MVDNREVLHRDGYRRVGVEEIDYRGRFGAIATSTTENEISIGEKYFTLDVDEGLLKTGDDVLVVSMDDQDCYMWGEIIGTDTVAEPLRVRVFIDDISAITNVSTNWEIQVVARPKPGIEKDTSLTEFDPTDGGPWTLTVTAGKFFPIGGTLLIKPTTDRTIAVIGEVKAYDDTDLTVSLRSTNATVSQSYDSWSIALLDSPPAALPLLSISGLKVSQTANARSLEISAGSIMDHTGAVLLTLDEPITKTLTALFAAGDNQGGVVQTAALSGTITSSGVTTTGTGTAFTSDFESAGAPDDYVSQGGSPLFRTNIATGSVTDTTNRIDSDTSITLGNVTLGASASTYYRNGIVNTNGSHVDYFVALIRRDTDGATDVCVSSWNPSSGEPDLPAGYTNYRLLASVSGVIGATAAADSYEVIQPLYQNTPLISVNAPVVLYDADLTVPGGKQLSVVGDVVPTVGTTIILDVANDKITNAKLRNSAALSVIGRSANSTGDPADIAAGTDGHVLRRSGTALGFGTIATAGVADDAVTDAKLANMAAYTLKGRNAGTTGDPSDISVPALTEKTTLVDDDLFLIADSAASNAFKKVKKSNVGGGITMGKAIAAAIVFG